MAIESGLKNLFFKKKEGRPFHIQERDPFDEQLTHVDQNYERRAPTPDEIARMDISLIKLGKLFENSKIRWQLDGALNISLERGEYIGVHKDVDISIERDEIIETDTHLREKGYAVFFSYLKDPEDPKSKRVMERVDAKKLSSANEESAHLVIAAIDLEGKIKEKEVLNFIDTHLVTRDVNGIPIGKGGVELPEEWFMPQPIEFKGSTINLSHPAKTAYFKLHESRHYDRIDLKKLAENGNLSLDDVCKIEEVISREPSAQKQAELVVESVLSKIKPNASVQDIFDAFAEEPRMVKSMETRGHSVRVLAEKVAAGVDKSKGELMRLISEVFDLPKIQQEQQEKITELRRYVEEIKINKNKINGTIGN